MAQSGDASSDSETILHATTVEADGRAALIRGASGTGKSGLALQLLVLGATLVSDDRTRVWCAGGNVMADAPETLRGKIEARGVGILAAPSLGPVPLALIVDMDQTEIDRLPPLRREMLLGVSLPVIQKSVSAHFPAAILLYLRHGRLD